MSQDQSSKKIAELESQLATATQAAAAKDVQIAALAHERDAALERERMKEREVVDLRRRLKNWQGGTFALGSLLALVAFGGGKGKR